MPSWWLPQVVKQSVNLVRCFVLVIGAMVVVWVGVTAGPRIRSGTGDRAYREIGGAVAKLIEAGKSILLCDRAQCLKCHSFGPDPKARCPDLEGIGARAGQRRPGFAAAEYFVESLYDPSAFTLPDYHQHYMPPANMPPIGLSHDEILAVIAFLNTLGGGTDAEFVERVKAAQAPWRKGLLKPVEPTRPEVLPGDVARGEELFRKQACIQCHPVGTEGRDVCPDLTAIAAFQSPEYILQSILEPSALIVKGYRKTIVLWRQEGRMDLWGTAVAWLPDKDHPRTLRISVEEYGKYEDRDVDLSKAAFVGDTIVAIEENGEIKAICGEHVSGDQKTGVRLRLLEEGRWVERYVPPEVILNVNLPSSPMPSNFAELLKPQEIYDLVAYLMAYQGKR